MSTAARLAALVGLTSLILAACGAAAPQPPTLDGRTFLSTGVEGHALVPGTQIRLTFQTGGELGASAGCNSIGGTYSIGDGTLRIQAGSMTEMGCDPDRHAQDDWLADFLGSDPAFTLTGNDLTLTANGATIRLLDREIAEPDLPLVGPTWTLAGIMAGDTVSSVPGEVEATLRFAPDGSVDVNAGCNRGGGTAAIQGGRITFGPIVTTKMACQGPAGEVEAIVLGLLGQGQLAFTVDASKLTLLAPNGSGIWFVAA